MKLMVISDLHYSSEDSWIWDWLLNIVDYHRPDLLLSCGDWGEEVSEGMFRELLERVKVLTIYGNHDNLEVLENLGIVMKDGVVYDYGCVKVAGINGIVSTKSRARDRIPRKSPEEFLSVAKKLRGKHIDILLLHEVPYIPQLFNKVDKREGSLVALEALKLIKPKIAVIGHIHQRYNFIHYQNDILIISIDTSRNNREYITINVEENNSLKVAIWRDYILITTLLLRE